MMRWMLNDGPRTKHRARPIFMLRRAADRPPVSVQWRGGATHAPPCTIRASHAMRTRNTDAFVRFSRFPRAGLVALVVLALVSAVPQQASASQDAVPPAPAAEAAKTPPVAKPADPAAAMEVIRKMIAAYRDAKGVEIEVAAKVGARKDGVDQVSESVGAKFLFSSERRAVVSLRGFDLRMADGKIIATHASNPLTYLQVSDNGSPYYSLFNAFQSLPFPELALALGEDDPTEVCMQLMPQIPNVVPVRVERDEIDGQVSDVLVLTSDDGTEELRLHYDPETYLVESARGVQRGGDMAEEGAELVWIVNAEARRPKVVPGAERFTLDVTSRQKVDGLAALVDTSEAAEEDAEVEGLKAGEPAPELTLPKLGGGEWNLTAARAKPVVLDFWATWCGPCRAVMPELARLQKEFAGRADVVLVNTGEQGTREEREARIRAILDPIAAQHGPLACVLDLDAMAARRWLVRAFPTTFLVDTEGRIAGVWIGSTPSSQRELREKLEALCAAKPEGNAAEKAAEQAPAKQPAEAPPAGGKPG